MYENILDDRRLAEERAAWVRKVKGRFENKRRLAEVKAVQEVKTAEAAWLQGEDKAEKAAEAAWMRGLLHQGIKAAEEEKEKESARELWLRRGVVRRSTTTDWFEEEFREHVGSVSTLAAGSVSTLAP